MNKKNVLKRLRTFRLENCTQFSKTLTAFAVRVNLSFPALLKAVKGEIYALIISKIIPKHPFLLL